MFDYGSLNARALAMQGAFRSAEPFPHVVMNNLFDADGYARVAASFPDPDSDIWKTPSNKHTQGKMVTKRGPDDVKENLYSEAARTVLRELNSANFLNFLENLSGVSGLIGDPHYAEAGFHCSRDGGYLDIHADFSHHDRLGLERRLNLILYLNDDWRDAYGGALKLYDQELKPVVAVPPHANRCVIFETSETSYHGHPEPMRLPDGVYRRSIALYYYSLPTGRAKKRIVFPSDLAFAHEPTVE